MLYDEKVNKSHCCIMQTFSRVNLCIFLSLVPFSKTKILALTQMKGALALASFPLDMDLTDYLSVHQLDK